MRIADAQREIRSAYMGGFVGQLVAGLIWLGAAALGTWGEPRTAILFIVVGGMLIYPLTRLGLAALRHPFIVTPGNPLNALGLQVALTLPLSLPVVGAAALYRLEWFFPAFMIVLGAHYLPFVFLYGMRMFGALSAVLVSAGLGLALYGPPVFAVGAWITSVLLMAFAVAGRRIAVGEAG